MTRVKASLASLVTRDERARASHEMGRATRCGDRIAGIITNHAAVWSDGTAKKPPSENEGEKEGETLCETTEEVSSRANRRRGADAGA